jgi:hypothetical protein
MISGIKHAALATAFAILGIGGMASAANAAVTWHVQGTFSDGTSLTGQFTTDVYGFVHNWDLFTKANGAFSAVEYDPLTSYKSSGNTFVDFQPNYFGDLHLDFVNDLAVFGPKNPIIDATSYECQNSFNCFIPLGGSTRYLTGGVGDFAIASVPEPATWAMLILGFGFTGTMLRIAGRRKVLATA